MIGPFAFKFARGDRGKRCNRFEAELFQQVNRRRREMLCPVLWCAPSGALLIARAAIPLTEAERDELWAHNGFPDWDYLPPDNEQPFEWKPSDWGRIKGRLVALDYSAPALFAENDSAEKNARVQDSENMT